MDFATSAIARRQDSADGTQKLLLTWGDDGRTSAETVMIPDGDRRTACVSSQVGCPVGCRFCASGINGVKGNLTADQIVEQVFRLNQAVNGQLPGSTEAVVPAADVLHAANSPDGARPAFVRPPRITNIVFMGMGEPLANYDNVMQAVRQPARPGHLQHRRPPHHDQHGRRPLADPRPGRRGSAAEPRPLAARPERRTSAGS